VGRARYLVRVLLYVSHPLSVGPVMEKVYSHAQVNLEHREEDRKSVIGYNCASIAGTWGCHETSRAAGDAFAPSHGIKPEIHCPMWRYRTASWSPGIKHREMETKVCLSCHNARATDHPRSD
jgi:hypothetical protein